VLDVALSQDGVLGASCSDDFLVKVWDLEHKECLQTCKGHTGWVVCVKVGAGVLGAAPTAAHAADRATGSAPFSAAHCWCSRASGAFIDLPKAHLLAERGLHHGSHTID
jgi:WD40 repeat protein